MFWTVTQSLLNGLGTTIQIFLWTLVFALPLGLLFAFASRSRWKPVRLLMQLVVWIVRGTPLMLQLIIIFYGPGLWLGHNIWNGGEAGRLTATIVAFSFNYACYFFRDFPRRHREYTGGTAGGGTGAGHDPQPDIFSGDFAADDKARGSAHVE